jgi:superfamily II DNA or RNA helicase
MTAILTEQQRDLLDEIRRAKDAGQRRITVQAPTGFGKTIVAANIAKEIQAAGKRMIFTVPMLSLIDQTVERFYAEGVRDVGVIQANHILTNYARHIQIASIETLRRREIPQADLVLIDEAHRWFGFYGKWLNDPAWAAVPFIGLSATPWTRGLGKHFHKLIIAATTRELIDDGSLSPFRVFAPSSPDLEGVRTVAGDYDKGDLSAAMNKSALVADVVDTWIDRAEGRPTLCFAIDCAYAQHLQAKFNNAGVPAGYIDAHTGMSERTEIGKQFHAGKVKVVCNVACLTTGIDWDVRCIVLARPTKSEMLFVQMIGRGLRTAEGKTDCLILDHSDNHVRLGFVTDIRHDELDDGRERQKAKRRETAPLPKKCPSCSFLKPPKVQICPLCGFKPEQKCRVINEDGELVELASRRAIKPVRPSESEQRLFYRQLKAIAISRNYKEGWIAHKFKENFGHWPPPEFHQLQPLEPSQATLRWVTSRQIAFARAQGGVR